MTPGQKAAHLAAVAERTTDPRTLADAAMRADAIEARMPPAAVQAIGLQMRLEKTITRRFLWLRHATDLLAGAAAGIAPCRAGCSDCCHMATIISSEEAERIAAASGRRVTQLPASVFSQDDEIDRIKFNGVPCPFLAQGRCSVYEVRPYSCRKHYSVDADNLLCKIVPGEEIRSPHYNAGALDALYSFAHIKLSNIKMADIRDFFPSDET